MAFKGAAENNFLSFSYQQRCVSEKYVHFTNQCSQADTPVTASLHGAGRFMFCAGVSPVTMFHIKVRHDMDV